MIIYFINGSKLKLKQDFREFIEALNNGCTIVTIKFADTSFAIYLDKILYIEEVKDNK